MEFWFRIPILVGVAATIGCGGNATFLGSRDGGDVGDAGGGDGTIGFPGAADMAPPATTHVAYRLASDGHVYRVAARAGSIPEDVSKGLTSAGSDSAVGLSRDGLWLGLLTTRFGCGSWSCLALVQTSPVGPAATSGTLVMAGGALVHSEGRPAIARDAAFIVYSAQGSGTGHSRDLFLARRSGSDPSAFDAPLLLTKGSTYPIHDFPALSADEQSVIADCGMASGGAPALCTVGIDGSGFRTVVTVNDGPGGGAEVHSGDLLPNGTLVFEGDWAAEQVWRRDAAGGLALIAPSATNDNSPCALPDGRIASLWLGRSGNPMGYHELKVMTLDGTPEMVVTGVDIADIGIGCGE
jgi:hypothetical protein